LLARLVELADEVAGGDAPLTVNSIGEAEATIREWRKIPGGTLDEIVRMYGMLAQLETAPRLSPSQAKLATAPVLQVAEALQEMVEKVRLRKAEAA
jgi:hypothetical protein